MGIFILIVLVCVAGLCFLGSRLNKVEDAEQYITEDESVATESKTSEYYEKDKSISDQQTQNDEVMEKEEKKYDMENPDTLGLMYIILCNIGCQPTKNPDDTILVKYQGENFHIEVGGMYARVWDPFWAEVKADDPDLPKIKEAVNNANFNFGPTVVFTNPDEEGVISLLSRRDIMLHPACPDNVPFVRAVLDSFFDAKNEVKSNYQKLCAKQSENQQSRRPVGFATDMP